MERAEIRIPLGRGDEMDALLVRPQGDAAAPLVIVFHDITGRSPFYEEIATRLATAGFTAVLPNFFFRARSLAASTLEALQARRREIDEDGLMHEFAPAIDGLRERTGASGHRVGTMGFCMGGTIALDLTAERGDLVTVCFYGFPNGNPKAPPTQPRPPLEIVDQLRGPILGFWGENDAFIDVGQVHRLAEALRSRGVSFEYTVYPAVGHGFLGAPTSEPATQEAATEAWDRSVRFLRHELGQQ